MFSSLCYILNGHFKETDLYRPFCFSVNSSTWKSYSGRDLAEDCCLFVHMLKMKTKHNCIHLSNAAESSGVCLMFISCQI